MAKDEAVKLEHMWPVFISGSAFGWLLGLSASPVLSGVLTALVGGIVGTVVGLNRVKKKKTEKQNEASAAGETVLIVDVRPFALLMLGIALFAPIGIMARAHELFGPGGDKPGEIASGRASLSDALVPALFSVTVQDCTELLAVLEDDGVQGLRKTMSGLGKPWANLDQIVEDDVTLSDVVRALCRDE